MANIMSFVQIPKPKEHFSTRTFAIEYRVFNRAWGTIKRRYEKVKYKHIDYLSEKQAIANKVGDIKRWCNYNEYQLLAYSVIKK